MPGLFRIVQEQLEDLRIQLADYGAPISDSQLSQLQKYVDKLLKWNNRVNLLSKKDECNIVERHIKESLSIPFIITLAPEAKLMDIGSGAGLPGIPLKIFRTDLRMVLVESKRMRALFLKEIVEYLQLERTEVVAKRVESLTKQSKGTASFDVVLARAVTGLDQLWQWAKPLLGREGKLVTLKGGDVREEISAVQRKDPNASVKSAPMPRFLVDPRRQRVVIIVQRGGYRL